MSVVAAITAHSLIASAGSIRLSIDGVLDPREWASGQAITIDLGPDPVQGTRTIHVWEDNSTNPVVLSAIVGPITVDGFMAENVSTRINVLIASLASTFPVSSDDPSTAAGALGFGTDPSAPAITFTDPELQRRCVLVVSVLNSLRGDITVGHIPLLEV